MTWELTVFLSVLVLCGTVVALFKKDHSDNEDFEKLWTAVTELLARVASIEDSHEAVNKLAEETKKMLSNENLAKSLRGPR